MPEKNTSTSNAPDEGGAITAIGRALRALDDESARNRVLAWAISAFGTGDLTPARQAAAPRATVDGGGSKVSLPTPTDLADLVERANPQNQTDRVLTVGYWLQTQSPNGFVGQAVNNELKNMGHAVGNITDKMTDLIKRKPALVLQVGKSGKARQARKTYRLTDAGKKRVEALLRGEAGEADDKE